MSIYSAKRASSSVSYEEHSHHAPSIAAHRVVNTSVAVAEYRSDRWPLTPLEGDSTRAKKTIDFSLWPEGFRAFAKEFAYALINFGNPGDQVDETYGPSARWPSPGTIYGYMTDVRRAARWLAGEWSERHPDTPVHGPSDIDTGHLDDLRSWVLSEDLALTTRISTLQSVIRAWHLAPQMTPECRWPEPSWRTARLARRQNEENRTVRITQETMGPLITWACAFVEDFAGDIFSAHDDFSLSMSKQREVSELSIEQCAHILDSYTDRRIPGQGHNFERGTARAAWEAVTYRHHGATAETMAQALARHPERSSFVYVDDLALGAIDYKPTAMFQNQIWLDGFSVLEVSPRRLARGRADYSIMLRHLMTACIIVVAYLTGARPEEVLGLEFGAAIEPVARSDGGRTYRIQGRVWKGLRRDSDGRAVEPIPVVWSTTRTAWHAVKVAEKIRRLFGSSSGLIFTRSGSTHSSAVANVWISQFADFVNRRLVPLAAIPASVQIPPDPGGTLTLRRFRRTLAWFLANRPGGEVTLAIQYHHMRTVIGSGYAGTKGSGMNALLREEDWAHRRATIQELGHLLASGEEVHGPGSARAILAARRLPVHLTPGEERRLRKDPDLVLYDNPSAIALCAFKESTALCKRPSTVESDAGPNLNHCDEACANIVRTTTQLMQIEKLAETLRVNAALSPTPMARSMSERAAQLEQLVAVSRQSGGIS